MTENVREQPFFIPESECAFASSRSGGPGGQNVNKVETRVTVAWNIDRSTSVTEEQRLMLREKLKNRIAASGDIILHCGTYRSRLRNKQEVVRRLTSLVQGALIGQPERKETKPSRRARERRLSSKRERAEKKEGRKQPRIPDY
ncbi:aminoacyl-tRNA hydrolase [Candidatus Uhrbacteria bacterium]|nr:aminoacyl-tRNA hydrolase [Candidatus Uhrbacteria bacterium]